MILFLQLLFVFLLCFCCENVAMDASPGARNRLGRSTSMFSPLPMYITARELAKLIETGHQSFVVIDVRDTDYETGKVVNSINVPFHKLGQQMDELMKLASQYKKMIFHCHFSQVRGPKSAFMFKRYYAMKQAETGGNVDLEILVLEDGFIGWHNTYQGNAALYERI